MNTPEQKATGKAAFRTNAGALKDWLEEEDLTPKEAAEILCVSTQAVHGWRRQNVMPLWITAFIAQRRKANAQPANGARPSGPAMLIIEGDAERLAALERFLHDYPAIEVRGPFLQGEPR